MINHQNSAAHHFDFSYFYDINIYYFLYYNKNVQKVQQFYTYKLLVLHSITTQVPLSHQNLFEAYLYTEFAPSKTEHEPQGGEPMSAELVAHKPHCSNRNLLQLFALVLCAPLPTRRKLRFHLCNSCISSLVFVVSEPCVRSTSERTGWNYFRPRNE